MATGAPDGDDAGKPERRPDGLDRLLAGEDPYEIDWPDDAADARRAEREKAAARAAVTPAPAWLTAAAVGATVVLLFLVPIAIAASTPAFPVAAALPVVLATALVGLPAYLGLQAATRPMPSWVTTLAMVALGGAIGYGLGYVSGQFLSASAEQAEANSSLAAAFTMTAVATAFVVAHSATEWLRYRPRQVYVLVGALAVLAIASAVVNFIAAPGAA